MDCAYVRAAALVVLVTGLFLSFQPLLQSANVQRGAITLEKLEGWMDQHDPERKARSLRIDWFQNVVSIGNEVDLDIKTGAESMRITGFPKSCRRRAAFISG